MLTFLEWVSQLEEGLLTPQQSEGDHVCFGIHGMDGPIDVRKMRHSISPIQRVQGHSVLVERPSETRHRGMKKMMCKDTGLLKLATSSLHKVPDEMVIGGDGEHKLFLYMPGEYHRGMARKIDKKMMASDASQQPQPGMPQTNMSSMSQPPTPMPAQEPQPSVHWRDYRNQNTKPDQYIPNRKRMMGAEQPGAPAIPAPPAAPVVPAPISDTPSLWTHRKRSSPY